MKNHDFTPKNHIFSNFRGVRAWCAPWIRPWEQSLFLLGIIRYPYEANLNKYKYTNQSFNIQKFALSVCSTWTILGKKSKKLYRYYFLNESLHSDLSTISTKRTLNAHLNSLNIKKDHDIYKYIYIYSVWESWFWLLTDTIKCRG